MPSVLLVSIAFPPKSDAEGLQVAKYLKYLIRYCPDDWSIDALTSSLPTLNMPTDSSLLSASQGARQIVSLRLFENRFTNFLLRRYFPRIQFPDSKFSFHLQAPLVPFLLKEPPSILYSRSFPTSSAVMALKLKRYYNVPWVMHLGDLWADCPEAGYRGRRLDDQQKIERLCFEAADAICVTSRKTLAFYENKYPRLRERLRLFPNVYDSEDLMINHEQTRVPGSKLRVVHTGSLCGDRSPEPFLQAIQSLSEADRQHLEVIFAGPTDRGSREVFKRHQMSCVRNLGLLSYREALELQRTADVLLLIDMPVAQLDKRVFFPSKVLDYMTTHKPILGLIDPGSEMETFLRERSDVSFNRHDVPSIGGFLKWLIDHRDISEGYFSRRAEQRSFEAGYNVLRLTQLLEELGLPKKT